VGGHSEQAQGVWGTEVPQWGPGAKPRYGVWGTKFQLQLLGSKSPRSWSFFDKQTLIFMRS